MGGSESLFKRASTDRVAACCIVLVKARAGEAKWQDSSVRLEIVHWSSAIVSRGVIVEKVSGGPVRNFKPN